MDLKPQKPPFLFASPFTVWTELAFKLWGFGKTAERSAAAEKQVSVAVIPTTDAQPPQPAKVARAHSSPKRARAKTRSKAKSKRARR